MFKWLSHIGPGTLIAAAFIGPGTVTICILAGVNHGFDLLWAMAFSVFATIILQEMSARIGLVTHRGIAQIIREEISQPIIKGASIFLILSAIVLGNAAYEAGNISGAIMGIDAVAGEKIIHGGFNYLSILVGAITFIVLYIGNYKWLERILVGVVILMSISFLLAAVMTTPSIFDILKGIFTPKIPSNSTLTIMGIVGTTVVPYNIFLHASLVKEKWKGGQQLAEVRKDLYLSILLGGFVSMMIIIAAASLQSQGLAVQNAFDMAGSLEPLFGSSARYVIGLGLFAAGVTSAITAPLAAAYVCTGLLGWKDDMKSTPFRLVWMGILGVGILFSSIGWKPIEIIKYAQLTNGILLPIIAGFLLWIVNKKSVVKHHRNTNWQNVLGMLILIITIVLGMKSVLSVLGML